LAGELVDHVAKTDLAPSVLTSTWKSSAHTSSGPVAASRSPRWGPMRCFLRVRAGRVSPSWSPVAADPLAVGH
jgi:hypothetical protein